MKCAIRLNFVMWFGAAIRARKTRRNSAAAIIEFTFFNSHDQIYNNQWTR